MRYIVTPQNNEVINLIKEKLDQIYGSIFSTEGINYIVQSISNIGK